MAGKQSSEIGVLRKRGRAEENALESDTEDFSYNPEESGPEADDDAESLSLVDENEVDENEVDGNEGDSDRVVCRGKGCSGLKLYVKHVLDEWKRKGVRLMGKGKHFKLAVEQWKALSNEQRQPWLEKAKAKQKEYWASHPREEGTSQLKRQPITIVSRCSPHKLGLLKKLVDGCENKKSIVVQLGMYKLLFCSAKSLSVRFAHYVASRFDPERRCIRVDGGDPINVDLSDVHNTLGIPFGDRQIPEEILPEESCERIVNQLHQQKLVDVYKRLEGDVTDNESFARDFLIYILSYFLCPTGSTIVSPIHYGAVSVGLECDKYNWCEHVLSFLCKEIAKWNTKRAGLMKGDKRKGKADKKEIVWGSKHGRVGGCLHLLVLLYIEKRGPTLAPATWSEFAIGRLDDQSISIRWEMEAGSTEHGTIEEEDNHEERENEEESEPTYEKETFNTLRQMMECMRRQETKICRIVEDITVISVQVEDLKQRCSQKSKVCPSCAHGRNQGAAEHVAVDPDMGQSLSAEEICELLRENTVLDQGLDGQHSGVVEQVDPANGLSEGFGHMVAEENVDDDVVNESSMPGVVEEVDPAHGLSECLGNMVTEGNVYGNVVKESSIPDWLQEAESCDDGTRADGQFEDARGEGMSVDGHGTGALHCVVGEDERLECEAVESNKDPQQTILNVIKDPIVVNAADDSAPGTSTDVAEGEAVERNNDAEDTLANVNKYPNVVNAAEVSEPGPMTGVDEGDRDTDRPSSPNKGICPSVDGMPSASRSPPGRGRLKRQVRASRNIKTPFVSKVYTGRRTRTWKYIMDSVFRLLSSEPDADDERREVLVDYGIEGLTASREDLHQWCCLDFGVTDKIMKIGSYHVVRHSDNVPPPMHGDRSKYSDVKKKFVVPYLQYIMCPVEIDSRKRHWCCVVFDRVAEICVVIDPASATKKLTAAHQGAFQIFRQLITDATLSKSKKWCVERWEPTLLPTTKVLNKAHAGWYVIQLMGSFVSVRQPFQLGELESVKRELLHEWCMDESNKNARRVAELAQVPL